MDAKSIAEQLTVAADILVNTYHEATDMVDALQAEIHELQHKMFVTERKAAVECRAITKLAVKLSKSNNPIDHKYSNWLKKEADLIHEQDKTSGRHLPYDARWTDKKYQSVGRAKRSKS